MLRALLVLALLATLVPSASADAPHTTPPAPPAPWQATYHQGSVAYDAGRLDEALADFQRAIELGGPPTVLYDLALTLDRLGRASDASAAYHRYLDAAPEASNRDVVEARLTELGRASSSVATHVAPPPSPILSLVTPEPTSSTTTTEAYVARPRTQDHWEQQGPEWTVSWVMLALTAATIAAAVIVWNDGLGHFQQLQDLCSSGAGCTATDIAGSSAHQSQDATNALLGTSIGLGVLTLLTFIVEGVVTNNRMRFVRGDASRDHGLRFGVGPFGVSLSGTF